MNELFFEEDAGPRPPDRIEVYKILALQEESENYVVNYIGRTLNPFHWNSKQDWTQSKFDKDMPPLKNGTVLAGKPKWTHKHYVIPCNDYESKQ